MSQAFYDDIADWYDNYLHENVLYQEIVLPTMLKLAGNIPEQSICDLACGQGWMAREFARRGARITGVDLSNRLLALARRYEEQEPLGITYLQGDVQQTDLLADRKFDGCMCVLALMDIPDFQAVFATVQQLLKPGGWFVFAMTHPCFELAQAQWITLEDGSVARAIRGYFSEGFWRSENGGVRSRVGAYHHTLSTYLNALAGVGFGFEQMVEPMATGERAQQVAGNREVPSLLFVRARKY